MSRRWVEWMPAIAMPAIVAVVVLAGPLQAAAPPELPAKTAEQLLKMAVASQGTAFSATVNQTVDLGLPQLPDGGLGSAHSGSAPSFTVSPSTATPSPGPGSTGEDASSALSPANLSMLVAALTTPHTARVYVDGATKVRIQVLDRLAERDFIRNGGVAWSYDSSNDSVTRWDGPPGLASSAPVPSMPMHTPGDVAAKVLQNIDPSTQVAVGENTRVAGRDAYVLELMPRAAGTLVGSISVAVDAETGLPLKVSIDASQNGKTAFETSFSQISLQAPAASVFDFTPPVGATVTEHSLPATPKSAAGRPSTDLPSTDLPNTGQPNTAKASITGTGWTSIVETPAGTVPASVATDPSLGMLLHHVSGGQALETTLLSVLFTPDGRALLGAVPLAALQVAAAAS